MQEKNNFKQINLHDVLDIFSGTLYIISELA